MNIFDALETRLEPKFNNIKFRELEPAEVVKQFSELGLLKQISITEASCDECQENCRGLTVNWVDDKPVNFCPTGFLETPRQLTPDETQGWQFDFNRLAELICAKSNLSSGGNETDNFLRPIALDQINAQAITVLYGYGLSMEKNFISRILETFSIYKAEEIFIVVPSNDALQISGINALKHIHLITLKDVLRNDFNISGIVKGMITDKDDVQVNRFIKQGNAWLISFLNKDAPVNDSTGMPYIRYLLANRNKKLNSLELQQAVFPTPPGKSDALYRKFGEDIAPDEEREDSPYLNDVSDKDVSELKGIGEELADAEKNEDIGQAENLRRRQQEILERYTKEKSETETPYVALLKKLQKSISANLDRAIDDIQDGHPEFASHLRSFINRSRGFVYQPDSDIDWQT